MSRFLSYFAAFLLTAPALAQHAPVNPAAHEIMEVIETMFDGMRAMDADKVAATFVEGAVLNSSGSRNDVPYVQSTPMADFVAALRSSAGGPAWDERVWNVEIEVNDNLATAWMDYALFVGDRFSHCGANTFQLARQADGHWRTIALADTRVMGRCMLDTDRLQEALVRTALRHYLRGHATGQGSEHQQAFHEVANLYFMRDGALQTIASADYIARASGQPAENEAERRRWIDWVDVSGDAAIGKITLDYPGATLTDYMQLLKVDGQWKIVNKIFSVDSEE